MEGNALVDGMNGVAMAQTLRDPVRPFRDAGLFHDGDHAPPGGGARPGPQELIELAAPAPPLDLGEAMNHVKRIEQHGRHGHGAVDALAAFFETFNDEDLIGEVYPSWG